MRKFRTNSTDVHVKEEMGSRDESGEEFIPDIRPTQKTSIYHLVPDFDIKHEEVDFHPNSASAAEDDSDRELQPVYVTGSTIPHVGNDSVQTEQRDFNQFNLDFLHNADAEDCETCQKYLRILSEHVRVSHAPPQPIRDPLLIDPLNIDPDPHHADKSSSIEIKYEIKEGIERMECSEFKEESESNDPDFVLESERDPDYSPSTHMTRNDDEGSNDSTSSIVRERKKQFKCNQCDKSFTTKHNMTVHVRTHTGERPYKCDVCDTSFSVKSYLIIHMRVHTGERPYKCNVCEKSFTQKTALNTHKRTHTGERPYKCDVCEKSFLSSSELAKHKSIHSGERLYECRVCEKRLTTQANLTRHNIIHSGVRPYKCYECEQSFKRSSHLVVHKRTHTGEKPYMCTVCEKSFTTSSVLNKHKRIHTRERP